MIFDFDVHRSANLLIKQHDEDAPLEGAPKADAMLDNGDSEGLAVWKRILSRGGVAGRAAKRQGDPMRLTAKG